MGKNLLILAVIALLAAPPHATLARSGRLSISDIEVLLRETSGNPRQRLLFRRLRATVCGSSLVKREIDIRLLASLDCDAGTALGGSGGPSFDCRKARTTVERLICDDPGLAALDVILADAYNDVLGRIPAGDRLLVRRDEAEWIAGRDRCVNSNDTYVCVTRAYKQRIQALGAY